MGIFKKTKPGWERVSWHGNPDLGHECWRKKFGHGYVYIGIGEFDLVSYSYGANSEKSIGSTRWHYGTYISEKDMMAHVDKHNGRHAEYPVDPKLYRAWWDGCTQDVKDAILAVGQPWHDMCQRIHDCHMNGVPAFPQRV